MGSNRFVETPNVNLDQIRVEPKLSPGRKNEIASEGAPDCVYRLLERMLCIRTRALRPQVGLDPLALESLPARQSKNGEQT
jgi:hypothetical protein